MKRSTSLGLKKSVSFSWRKLLVINAVSLTVDQPNTTLRAFFTGDAHMMLISSELSSIYQLVITASGEVIFDQPFNNRLIVIKRQSNEMTIIAANIILHIKFELDSANLLRIFEHMCILFHVQYYFKQNFKAQIPRITIPGKSLWNRRAMSAIIGSGTKHEFPTPFDTANFITASSWLSSMKYDSSLMLHDSKTKVRKTDKAIYKLDIASKRATNFFVKVFKKKKNPKNIVEAPNKGKLYAKNIFRNLGEQKSKRNIIDRHVASSNDLYNIADVAVAKSRDSFLRSTNIVNLDNEMSSIIREKKRKKINLSWKTKNRTRHVLHQTIIEPPVEQQANA
jgi:hypothetical protein